MKVLTLCQGGNCRSVALGFVLKYSYGHDAIACGWEKNSAATIEMLADWADRIIVVESHFVERVPDRCRAKVSVYDVGPDRWFNSLHLELIGLFNAMILQDPTWPA
jgi:hypothetical protein